MIYETVGINIMLERRRKKISQIQMAKDLNMSVVSISKYECGKTPLDLERLEKIANYLNVSVYDLIKIN